MGGKCYFPATEKILGYAEPEKAVRMHRKGASKLDSPSNGGIQKKNFIPEGDLYRLIVRSKLPTAPLPCAAERPCTKCSRHPLQGALKRR